MPEEIDYSSPIVGFDICGRIPALDFIDYAMASCDYAAKIYPTDLGSLVDKGYGKTWPEIDTFFKEHFSECQMCRHYYESNLVDYHSCYDVEHDLKALAEDCHKNPELREKIDELFDILKRAIRKNNEKQ